MFALARVALLLVIVLVSLSAYLRLAHSGIGCPDWPACYGRIGPAPQEPAALTEPPGSPYQRLADQANEPMAWATPLHRLIASVLGLVVVALNVTSWKRRRDRMLTTVLLALTVFLAVLGVRSGTLHEPAVVMGNLAGGFAMLGLLGWLSVRAGPPGAAIRRPGLARWTLAAIAALSIQIALGGLTSANFAATACRSLPDCHGQWWPDRTLLEALDLSRSHEVTPSGVAVGGGERIAIHVAHRLGAVAALVFALAAAAAGIMSGGRARRAALVVVALVAIEFALGVATVLAGLPIGLAVAHNWLAALLLLGLLRLLALSRTAP